MDTSTTPPPPSVSPQPAGPKKGMGTGAKVGIGCGIILLLAVIVSIIGFVLLGAKVKKFAEDSQQNPTRATAELMTSVSAGTIKMVAEDDVNKRYTVSDASGKLTTVYWNEEKKAVETVVGDFSAIPGSAALQSTPLEPAPPEEETETE